VLRRRNQPWARAPAAAALLMLLAVAVGVRLWAVGAIAAPWIMIDELLYASLAESLAQGRLEVRGEARATSVLYPLLIAPAWLAREPETTYLLAKAINVLAMSAVAVPVFLWARHLADAVAGLVAAGLALLLSGLVFTTALMTENLFLPLVVAAAYALARALEEPRGRRWALVLGLTALVVLTRVHGLVLVPILVLASVLFAALAARLAEASLGRELRRSLPWAGASVALLVLVLLGPALPVLDVEPYEDVLEGGYQVAQIARWGLYNTAALALAAGILPVLASVGLAARATTRADLAFVATAAAVTAGLVAVAAVMSTLEPPGLRERYVFHAAPLFLVGFAVWLRRGARRSHAAAAAAAALVALVALLPLRTIFGSGSFLGDGFSLIAFWRIARVVPGDVTTAKVLLVAGTASACALFLLAPRRLAPSVLPAAVAAYLVASSAPVFATVRSQAIGAALASGQRERPTWIDDAVGRDAEVVFLNARPAHPPEWMPVWHAEFWNRSLAGVVNFGAAEPTPLPQRDAALTADGRIEALPPHVVVLEGVQVDGEEVAREGPLRLVRVEPPVHVAAD
jgi:hypothetical protein